MKKTILFVLLAMLALSASMQAQQRYDLNKFTGIRSEGDIPADMRKSLDQLYSEDKQRVKEYNGRVTNREAVMQQSYFINRLTVNGRILYGDPITQMVERIADTLLKDYPELRKELRFYTVKSPAVNAFATGQGMIFVNLGLVAQSENEAQLAFIIGHEIIHYYRNHNTENLTRKKRDFKKRDDELTDFLRKHNRSHEMEREADSLSLRMFYLSSPYDKQVTDGVFDVLQYAYLPFGEVPIDTNMFNSPYFKLSSNCFLSSVAEISARDDYNDTASTHPNIRKRRHLSREILQQSQGGSPYVVTTESEYAYLRNLARLECIRQEIIYGDYARAYYDSYVTLRQLPNNPFLERCQAQALYFMAMRKAQANTNAAIGDYRKYEGEIQQLYYLLSHTTSEQMALIAVRELWKAHLRSPQDADLLAYCKEMMHALSIHCKMSYSNFASTPATVQPKAQAETESPSTTNDKYAKIRQKTRAAQELNTNKYAFTDFMMADTTFSALLSQCMSQPPAAETEHHMSDADGVFVFAPFYGVISDNGNEFKYHKSDALEEQMSHHVDEAAKAAELNTVNFTDPALRSHTDAEFYNDFVTLNEWTNEYLNSRSIKAKHLFTQSAIESLSQKYNASYLSLNAVGNAENLPPIGFGIHTYALIISIAAFPAFPPMLFSTFSNRQRTYTENMIIDIRNTQTISKHTGSYNFKDNPILVQNDIYQTMHEAKGSTKPAGLMGKRLMVSAGCGFSFPLFNKILSNREPQRNLDIRPAIELSYTTRKHQAVALWFDYNPTKFDFTYQRPAIEPQAKAHLLSTAITYRWSLSECIMPLGTYIGAGLQGSRISLAPLDAARSFKHLSDSAYYRGGIHLELGRNFALSKHLVLNCGVRYTFTIANPFEKDYDFDFSEYLGTTTSWEDADDIYRAELEKTNIHRMLNASTWITNMMMVNINLGLLPF